MRWREDLPEAMEQLRRAEAVSVPLLPKGTWRDENLRRHLRERAHPRALAALKAEDWPAAYRSARILFDAGDEVEGNAIIALLQHKARPFYDDGSRLLRRKRTKAEKAEGRRLLKLVISMTGPEWRLHQPAKDKLAGKKRGRRQGVPEGIDVPRAPPLRH
ncbi:MAG: hypothetical protein P1V51_17415 [Deltaproteobacteria bacterium]|nr:hypothetical protein [Deltaproteobacteria bacterium]